MFQIALPYDRKKDPDIEFFQEEDDFIDSLRGNIKNNVLLSLKEEDHKNEHLIFTRKCKAGIRWAAYSEVAVHFILDELNMKDIVLKAREYFTSGPKQGQRKGGVTASELRWIYRNRFDPRIISSVQFWLNGDPVPPPWTHEFQIININQDYSSDIWKLYEPKVVPKFLAQA
jgi:hypothetical protein